MGSLHYARPDREPASSNAVRAFSIVVALGGALGIATLPLTGLRESLGTLAVLVVLSAISGSMSVHVPRSRVEITPGDAFVFAALVAVGPFAAPLVAMAGVLGALVVSRRAPSIRIVFNLGGLAMAATAAAWAYTAMLGVTITPSSALVALFAAVGAFFLVNTLLVACVIRLHTGAPLLRSWCRSGLWTLTSSLTNGLLAFGLASVVAAVGPVGLTLGLVGALSIAGSYTAHRDSDDARPDAPAVEARVELTAPPANAATTGAEFPDITVDPSYLPRVEIASHGAGGEPS